MSLEAIQQGARSMLEALKALEELERNQGKETEKRRDEVRKYILGISKQMQRYIDEEHSYG